MRNLFVILLILALILSGCSLGGPKTSDTDVASGNEGQLLQVNTDVEVNSTKVETTNIEIRLCEMAEYIASGSCNVIFQGEVKP